MKFSHIVLGAAAAVLLAVGFVRAEVRISHAFTDHAVLQRHMPVPVWGWADPGEKVTVSFAGQSVSTEADESGKWSVRLSPLEASSQGRELTAQGANTVTLRDILVGEVWVCSGQSNMEWTMQMGDMDPNAPPKYAGTEEERTGKYPLIRYNQNNYTLSKTAYDDVLSNTGWVVCCDAGQGNCTAVGFHFAVRLQKELDVPIGLISASWGGSFIESWMPDEAWSLCPEITAFGEQRIAERTEAPGCDFLHPGEMFYAKIAPWIPYAIRGTIWYQGCANSRDDDIYYYKQKALIESWRARWNEGDFPFYWVQLSAWANPSDDPNFVGGDITDCWYAETYKTPETDLGAKHGFVWIRDAQTRCLDLPNTGQAVSIDVGAAHDIHPRNKFTVGNRLAVLALANEYGKDIPCRSPQMKTVEFDGPRAIVRFDHCAEGLTAGKQTDRLFEAAPGEPLRRFALAGEDHIYHFADAVITGPDTVEITSEEVPHPVAVRYAWQMNPEGCNLYNSAGLPAVPFRTDDWDPAE